MGTAAGPGAGNGGLSLRLHWGDAAGTGPSTRDWTLTGAVGCGTDAGLDVSKRRGCLRRLQCVSQLLFQGFKLTLHISYFCFQSQNII